MRLSFLLLLCCNASICFGQIKPGGKTGQGKPFILGTVLELDSKLLAEKRIVNVQLPDGYNAADTTRYPVVYLLDGSADEDFIHIAGLYHFNSFPWVNKVAKTIIVGIANVDRRRDYTFSTTIKADKDRYPTSGHSDNFIAFIEQELQPHIDQEYKTSASRTIIGQSLGGLLATEILFKKPMLFDRYIIISPSLWWDNGSLLTLDAPVLRQAAQTPTSVYIAVGKEGLTPTAIPRVMEVDANLLAEKLTGLKNNKLSVYFDYLPEEDHGTIMHQAVANALKILNQAAAKN